MGDFLFDVMIIKDIYHNAQTGIASIDEVIYKIKKPKLLKEIKVLKKEYYKICKMCKAYLKDQKEEVPKPKMITKISSEFITQMKLFKDDSDKIIVDMLLKATQKSLDILKSQTKNYKKCERKTKKIIKCMLNTLNASLKNLQRIYQLYYFTS